MTRRNTYIAERLRDCRERCALTQAQVAAALNIDRSTYSYYELGHTQPGLDMLVRLAGVFKVPVDSLLPDTNSPDEGDDSSVLDTRVNPIYQLSKDERGLIVSYRVLSPEQKESLRRQISEMIKTEL